MRCITYGHGNRFSLKKFHPVKNEFHPKPIGGLWGSPSHSVHGWRNWCINNHWPQDWNQFFEYTLDGNILTIDQMADLTRLPWREPFPNLFYPDYETLLKRQHIDALYLTANGVRATHCTWPRHLNGWDCESILVLNPAIVHPIE